MDFSPANCAKVMKELAKARVKMPPYDTTGGWRDPDMWSTLMRAVVGSNCPKMRDSVLEIIFTFEYLFMQGGRFKITDDRLRTNVYTVFGPGRYGDAGSLRTCDLDPSFLAVRKVDYDAVPLSILEYDGDGAGQHGGGPSNSPPNQKSRKKAKMTFSAPTDFERLSNPKSPSIPPRIFKKPMFTILTRNDMVQLYDTSTKHLTPEDAAVFLYFVPPGSAAFQSLALLPFAERKATIDAAVKEYKVTYYEPHPPPPYYLSHHQQE
ncbi:hypothetical protein RND81_07G163500 [Saponaria officinalis]|uniref:Uncharacterized protein n=1 Tax=Saponaria officinalis TaxID=3572 RepID=A0AAW1JSX5_SAPOF